MDTSVFQPTLHYLQDVPINSDVDPARILWDDGSNRVLVCHAFAAERKLRSRVTTVTMKVVGGCYEKVKTNIYELDLVDKFGKRHSIWGYGIDTIIDPDDPVDLAPVRSLFPHLPREVFLPLPKKRVDILIGLNFNSLHPSGGTGKNIQGNLKALNSIFGTGWVIGGCHQNIKATPNKLTPEAATSRVAKISGVPEVDVVSKYSLNPVFARIQIDPVLTPEFWESDCMGVLPPRKCNRCRTCALKGECSEQQLQHSLKEITSKSLMVKFT